jgi:hypothetical protein
MNMQLLSVAEFYSEKFAPASAEALDKAVIYKAATPKFFEISIDNYSGVSTYIPVPYNTVLADKYKTLKWNEATGFIE